MFGYFSWIANDPYASKMMRHAYRSLPAQNVSLRHRVRAAGVDLPFQANFLRRARIKLYRVLRNEVGVQSRKRHLEAQPLTRGQLGRCATWPLCSERLICCCGTSKESLPCGAYLRAPACLRCRVHVHIIYIYIYI